MAFNGIEYKDLMDMVSNVRSWCRINGEQTQLHEKAIKIPLPFLHNLSACDYFFLRRFNHIVCQKKKLNTEKLSEINCPE